MGDMGEMYRDWKDYKKKQRDKYGKNCQGCVDNHPNRNPSILLPGQKCRWCEWVDKRTRKED